MGFIASTRVFSLPTCAFNLASRGFSVLTREVELVTRGYELVTRNWIYFSTSTYVTFFSKTLLMNHLEYSEPM